MITPDNRYYRQMQLLVRALPYVARENCFGLKGGTAINLFLRDLPRLSVDIDLAYLPIADYQQSRTAIDAALGHIRDSLAEGSVKRLEPRWELLGLEGVDRLPAVRWKLHNLDRMDKKAHQRAVDRLTQVLERI